MREKLIELLEQAKNEAYGVFGSMNEGFGAWYADHLLANGVIVLPCKVGQEVWCVWAGSVHKAKCSMLTQKADGSWKVRFSVDNGWGSSLDVTPDNIGKTVFLTRELAEAALKEGQG